MKKKKKITTKAIVEFMILESYTGVLRHQRLIDEWDNPNDIVQRSAVIIRDTHQIYGKFASMIYLNMVKKK